MGAVLLDADGGSLGFIVGDAKGDTEVYLLSAACVAALALENAGPASSLVPPNSVGSTAAPVYFDGANCMGNAALPNLIGVSVHGCIGVGFDVYRLKQPLQKRAMNVGSMLAGTSGCRSASGSQSVWVLERTALPATFGPFSIVLR